MSQSTPQNVRRQATEQSLGGLAPARTYTLLNPNAGLPPFQNPLTPEVKSGDGFGADSYGQQLGSEGIAKLLPASYRIGKYKSELSACSRSPSDAIKSELDIDRLDEVLHYFWLVGKPLPPRSLHTQQFLGREIVVNEAMDMHLVWAKGKIFIKPLPRFLLEPRVWAEYFACESGCGCPEVGEGMSRVEEGDEGTGSGEPKTISPTHSSSPPSPSPNGGSKQAAGAHKYGVENICDRRRLRKRAFGFLFSYASLIVYESDFAIARSNDLVPKDLAWDRWRVFVDQLLGAEGLYNEVDRRFWYGELRLGRLNKINFFRALRFYTPPWTLYKDLFEAYLGLLASATVYIAVVLTAMQVGLATPELENNKAFLRASYGFTVFSILGPLVFVALVFVLFLYMFITNAIGTLSFRKKRFQEIHGTYRKS